MSNCKLRTVHPLPSFALVSERRIVSIYVLIVYLWEFAGVRTSNCAIANSCETESGKFDISQWKTDSCKAPHFTILSIYYNSTFSVITHLCNLIKLLFIIIVIIWQENVQLLYLFNIIIFHLLQKRCIELLLYYDMNNVNKLCCLYCVPQPKIHSRVLDQDIRQGLNSRSF